MQYTMNHSFTFEAVLHEGESSLMWYCWIEIPSEIVKKIPGNLTRRVLCKINNQATIQVAILPDKKRNFYITLNKEIRKQLKLETGDRLTVEIMPDKSEYGIATPEFFTEFCAQDPEGSDLFHQLTPGKQRSLIYIINKPKSENKKIEKACLIFDYLKGVNGKLNFRELSEAMKQSRFKAD